MMGANVLGARPDYGPKLWRVPGTDGLVLAAAPAVGSPSVSAPITWRFPKAVFVCGVLVLLRPRSSAAMPGEMAQVSLRIIDESNQPIINDTRGTIRGTQNAPVAAPLLALHGKGFHPHALQRAVASQDQWHFVFENEDTAHTEILSGVFLYFERAHQ